MYLWDIQYKIWYERVATNSKLYQMNIKDTELCEYCQLRETNVHAFVLCERIQNLWSEITLFLLRIGYRNLGWNIEYLYLETQKWILFLT